MSTATQSREHSIPDDTLHPDSEVQSARGTVHAHAPRPLGRARAIGLIATCATATILNSANNTAVAISLPTLGRDLGIPEYRLQWAISSYALTSGGLLLFFGRVADLYGRKRSFLAGALCLAAFCLGCAFAKDEIQLDMLRGFQGMGAAACIPAGLGILAHAFPPSRIRSVAFATFAAGAPIGAAIGSAIGGMLTQWTEQTWRSTFYFLTGMSFLCFVGALVCFDPDLPSEEEDKRIDWLGAFLITAALVLIVFVLSDGTMASDGWRTGYIIALLILGVISLVLYVVWERFLERAQATGSTSWWTPPPIMKVSLWARAKGKLAVIFVLAFLEYGSFIVFNFWITLYYQNYVELSPVLTMIRLLPMSVTGLICNALVALFVGRVPVVFLITFGTAMTAVANLLYGVINPAAPYWAFGFPAAIVSVFGADFVFASGTLFVAKVCMPHEQSVGGAMFQTMTQLGSAIGLAITTIVFNTTLAKTSLRYGVVVNIDQTNAPKSAQLVAYKDALWTGFAFGIFGTLLAVVFLRGAGIVGHRNDHAEDDAYELSSDTKISEVVGQQDKDERSFEMQLASN
ncbi:efflux transporter [Wolfiporia cocos MD-104 SS10]|uniref:Efflux transporter n=1 Tax=Wolfiporia cocos (strain MD-104) TaxID=742152 RepID=A0A2H3JR39_WOLCO|nr:efflux transporter [Wolfiporia cocos MD-104 SS10]